MLIVSNVASHVLATTRPSVSTDAVNDRISPLTLEDSAIGCHINPCSTNHIVVPCALVFRAVNPMIASRALLLAIGEAPLVSSPFSPPLHTITILQIPTPLAMVCCTALMVVASDATCHVVTPFSHVHITITMSEATFANCKIRLPLPYETRAIRPYLLTYAMPHIVFPLTCVYRSTLESVGLHVLHTSLFLKLIELSNLAVEI
mmetsp:Transcript_36736/g.58796  ORF Transcript_36736/g.58796 Transcript_36736/m.58796 type:complete len:204 (+) Transcript_36736:353-964(+)